MEGTEGADTAGDTPDSFVPPRTSTGFGVGSSHAYDCCWCLCVVCRRALFAQEWNRYQNLDDRFAVTAPGPPAIEKTKWKSEYDSMFPATIYRWQQGQNRYAVTVVDYSDSEAIYLAKQAHRGFSSILLLADRYSRIDPVCRHAVPPEARRESDL